MSIREYVEQFIPEDPDDTAHAQLVLTLGFGFFLLMVGYMFDCAGGSCQ